MKRGIAILFAVALAAGTQAAARNAHRLRANRREALGKRAAAGSVAHAGFGQVRNSPHEWGQGAAGFAKRVGSGLGQHVVKTSIQMGVGALHHENLRYRRSNRHGTWPRMKYAVKSTFVVPRTNRRGKTVALGRVSGAMGAGMISRAWQPASAAGIGAGVTSGGVALGADVGANMAREFWPRHRKGGQGPGGRGRGQPFRHRYRR